MKRKKPKNNFVLRENKKKKLTKQRNNKQAIGLAH